jgi:hypothetical protein
MKIQKPLPYTARPTPEVGGKQLRRRHFLRGMGGVALGLPFLEALAPRGAGAQTSTQVKRFGVFFACNGVDMARWFPNGDFGALSEQMLAGTANEALTPYLDKLLFPRGVHMSPRGWGIDGGGADDHGKGMAHKLTAQFADEEDWLAMGPSLDYVLAQQINPGSEGSRTAALNLLVGRGGNYRGLDYSSYSGPMQAILGINNPWNAYAQFINLGGSGEGGEGGEATSRLTLRRESVLDLVSVQFDDLKRGPLSTADKQKLDAHFSAIREIEMQMAAAGMSCGDATLEQAARAYEGVDPEQLEQNDQYPNVALLQVDIMALALACDYTRVATVQFDRGSGGPTFTWDGMNHEYNHHKLSHGKVRDDCFGDSTEDGCADVAGYEDMLFDIDRWHQQKFARLLERLSSYTEEDGSTVLDNSVILYTNELSDGKGHSFLDLPYILAGSAGGYFKQGQYVQLATSDQWDDSGAPHNQLLNTIVNAMGVPSDWFGAAEGSGGASMKGGVFEQLLA